MANRGPLAPTGSNTQKLRSIISDWAWARAGTTRLALRAAAATTRRERLDNFTGSLLIIILWRALQSGSRSSCPGTTIRGHPIGYVGSGACYQGFFSNRKDSVTVSTEAGQPLPHFQDRRVRPGRPRLDRKSTRLNS